MYRYFDIHSHIQFPDYDTDREEVLARMRDKDVGTIVVGTDAESSQKAIALAEMHDGVFASAGLHPNDAAHGSFDDDLYRTLLKHDKVVAVGECGLDYFRTEGTEANKKRQKEILEKHIALAVEFDKPLMLHVRDARTTKDSTERAYGDTLAILAQWKKTHGARLRGNVHFFAGTAQTAKRFAELNFTVSFTGVITFAKEYESVVPAISLDMMMSETDCPFVAPVPFRGKRNEPAYVIEVVKKIALLREESEENVSQQIRENVRRVFQV